MVDAPYVRPEIGLLKIKVAARFALECWRGVIAHVAVELANAGKCGFALFALMLWHRLQSGKEWKKKSRQLYQSFIFAVGL